MLKVFGGLWKKIMFGFMKDIWWSVTKEVVWNTVLFCQMNYSEQEFENLNRAEVGKFSDKEPSGSDNNGEEQE